MYTRRRRETGLRSRRSSSAPFEPLEPRLLLAGDVVAVMSGGSLVITGDAAGSNIRITAGADFDQFVVASGDGTTRVNGGPGPVTVPGITKDFKLNMGDGNDQVTLAGLIVPGSVKMAGGGGFDALNVTGPVQIIKNVTLKTAAGGEMTWLNAQVGGSMKIQTGTGTLNLMMNLVQVIGGISVKNANGDLTWVGMACTVGDKVGVKIGDGLVDVRFITGSAIGGSVGIKAGSGISDTSFWLNDSQVVGNVSIKNGSGGCTAMIEAGSAIGGNLSAQNKAGNTIVQVNSSRLDGTIKTKSSNVLGLVALTDSTVEGGISVVQSNAVGMIDMLRSDAGGLAVKVKGGSARAYIRDSSTIFGDVSLSGNEDGHTFTLSDSEIGGSIYAKFKRGDAHVTIDPSRIGGDFRLAATGPTAIRWEDVIVDGSITVKFGPDDDHADFRDVTVAGKVHVSTGDGNDMIYVDDGDFTDAVSMSGVGRMSMFLDTEPLEGGLTRFRSTLTVKGGGGDDMFIIGTPVAGTYVRTDMAFALDGGAGDDALEIWGNGNLFVIAPVIKNIEATT